MKTVLHQSHRLFLRSLLLWVATTSVVAAQAEGDATNETDVADSPAAAEADQLRAIRAELAEQRQMIEAQREELDAQRRELEQANDDEELGALLSEIEDDPELEDDEDIVQIHGFMDFGFRKFFIPASSFLRSAVPEASTFVLGNLNLYLDLRPHPDWRGLLELRFTTLPHGDETSFASPAGTSYVRVDRFGVDLTSPNARNNVLFASVIIERAWIDYAPVDWLKIRTGYFFTPYGIWNLDHGSPTLISLLLPDSQVVQAFPLQQLGLRANGTFRRKRWDVSYWAYVSNGRQPAQFDFSEDKAVGGRLEAGYRNRGDSVVLGASGYWGTFVDIEKNITSFDPFVVDTDRVVSLREWAIAFDFSLDFGDLRWRNEFTLRRVEARNGLRRQDPRSGPGALESDHYYWNVYTLLAYRLPYGIEPYVYFELVHRPLSLGDTTIVPSIGLNVHFNPAVSLKMQFSPVVFTNVSLPDVSDSTDNNFSILSFRLVLAF